MIIKMRSGSIYYPRRLRKQNTSHLKMKTGWRIFLFIGLFFITLFITSFELKLLYNRLLVLELKNSQLDYEAFRDLKVDLDILQTAKNRVAHLISQHPELSKYQYIDTIGFLTYGMMAREYNPAENGLVDEQTFRRGIGEVGGSPSFQELYEYYKAILSDLKYFPVPEVDPSDADINYENSWYFKRTYGGNRKHEGTDLMASNNTRGYFPVVSMTDGVVEKMGWLDQGGYRIGVRSNSGGYFYYAHLYSYAPDIKEGKPIIAGQILGFMGDSGYGSEGTIGKFDVHLHFGIYINTQKGETSINPYYILKMLEVNRTRFHVYK